MKNTFVKVLSFLMALTMIVGMFSAITVSAAEEEHTHTKGEVVDTVAPTCVKSGYTIRLCATCGEEYMPADEVVKFSPDYHNFVEVEAKAPTCLEPEYTAGKQCSHCKTPAEGATGAQPVPNTQKSHRFVPVPTPATCTENEKIVWVCMDCDNSAEEIKELVEAENSKIVWVNGQTYEEFKSDDIDDTAKDPNHNGVKWEVVTAPVMNKEAGKCTDGLLAGTCELCNETLEKVIPVAHDYTINLNPNGSDCAEYIKDTMACSICGDVKDGANRKTEKRTDHNADGKGFDDVVFDPENLPKKSDGTEISIAFLTAAGFKPGDTLYKPATCDADGIRIVECKCGEVYLATVEKLSVKEHKAENLKKGTTYVWPNLCTEATYRIDTCKLGCGYELPVVVRAASASAHDVETKTEDPTCTDYGFTTAACKNTVTINGVAVPCAHGREVDENGALKLNGEGKPTLVEFNLVDKLGHTLEAPYWVEGDCGADDVKYEQKCSTCNAKVPAEEPEGTKHIYTPEIIPATCLKAEYTKYTCSICGDSYDEAIDGAKVDPTNHVYPEVVTEENALKILKAPTCTETGKATVVCQNPDCNKMETVKEVVLPVAKHTTVTGSKVEANKNYKADQDMTGDNFPYVVTTTEVPATCQATGLKANGEFCKVCGYEKKAAKVIEIDKTAHLEKEEVGSTDATCQSAGKIMYTTPCCGIVTEIDPDQDKKVACNYIEKTHQNPTCTEDGYHYHFECEWCGTYKPESVETTGCELNCKNHAQINDNLTNDYVIKALDHEWKKFDGKPETCTNLGYKEFYYCSRHTKPTFTEVDGVRKYDFTGSVVTFDKATLYIMDSTDPKFADSTAKEISDEITETAKTFAAAIEILAHGNTYKKPQEVKEATCTSQGSVATKADGTLFCSKCEKDDWKTPKKDHTFRTISVNMPSSDEYDCTKASAIVRSCDVCDAIDDTFVAHTDAKGNKYYGYFFQDPAETEHKFPEEYTVKPLESGKYHCTTNIMESRKCENCKVEDEQLKEAATGHWTTKGAAADNAQKFIIDFHCDKIEEFIGYACGDCGMIITNETAVEHYTVSVEKKPTCLEDGFKLEYCKVCDYENEVTEGYEKRSENGEHTYNEGKSHVIDYKKPTLTEDGYTKYICDVCEAEATKIEPATAVLVVNGALSAEEVYAGTTFEYTVRFSGVDFEFNALKLNVAFDTGRFDVVSVSTTLENALVSKSPIAAGVGVTIGVPNTADGEKQTVTTSAKGTDVITIVFQAKKYAVGESNEFKTTVVVNEGKENEKSFVSAAGKAVVNGLGDLNGDNLFSIEDAIAISNKFNTTDAASDINGDGLVDIDDFALVATFAASDKTAKDYLIMLGTYADIEATIKALLDDNMIADVNDDGDQDINDYYKLTNEVNKELAKMDTVSKFNYASAEEFVMSVMNSLIKQ